MGYVRICSDYTSYTRITIKRTGLFSISLTRNRLYRPPTENHKLLDEWKISITLYALCLVHDWLKHEDWRLNGEYVNRDGLNIQYGFLQWPDQTYNPDSEPFIYTILYLNDMEIHVRKWFINSIYIYIYMCVYIKIHLSYIETNIWQKNYT